MNIKDKYIKSIKEQNLILVNPEGYSPPVKYDINSDIKPLILAPVNTNVFNNKRENFVYKKKEKIDNEYYKDIINKWDWRNVYVYDDKNIIEKKRYIEKPRNQYYCGSCWAMSVASVISDKFVCCGLFNYAPNLSTTYILSKYKEGQFQCGGGSVIDLYYEIEKYGIATNNCVDYEWCSKSEYCNQNIENNNGGKEFNNPREFINFLNSLIPEEGCYYPENKDLYKIRDIEVYNNFEDNKSIEEYIEYTKTHIYKYGPISSGFIVFINFLGGNFGVTKGIYIESVDYINSSEKEIIYNNDFTPTGGHSVSVIGWGKEYIECFGEVSYWYCRNTWGNKWGEDEGYFKFAMYPINKESRFDVTFDNIGGFIFCKAYKVEEDKVNKRIYNKSIPEDIKYRKEAGEEGIISIYDTKYINEKNSVFLYVFFICLIMIIAILIYFRSKEMKIIIEKIIKK